MLFNQGTFLVVIILGVSVVLLVLFLLILGLAGRHGNKKGLGFLKALTIIFAVSTMIGSLVTPLVYYNYIDFNLRYGRYNQNGSATYYLIHRDSVELHFGSVSEGVKGTWTLENNILTIKYGSSTIEYTVEDYGTKLCQNGQTIFRYTKH